MSGISDSNLVITKVKDCLIVTVRDDLSGVVLEEMQRKVLKDIQEKSCLKIIFELSALKFMDTIEFESLKKIAEMASILGAESIFVGIKAGIVNHLIMNDAETSGLNAELDLNEALEKLGIIDVAS